MPPLSSYSAAERLPGFIGAQSAELDPGQRGLALRSFERGCQPLRHLAGAHGQREQHRRSRQSAQQRPGQLHRRQVGPVNLIEHQYQRPGRGKPRERVADGAMAAVALMLQRHLTAVRQCRQ